MTKIWLHGLNGKMGKEIYDLINSTYSNFVVLGGSSRSSLTIEGETSEFILSKFLSSVEEADIIIDFSTPAGNKQLFAAISSLSKKRVLIGTTGLSESQINDWKDSSHTTLVAPNTSLGILLTMQISRQISRILHPLGFDIELIESHHRSKQDSPSGTALFIAEALCKDSSLIMNTNRQGPRSTNELGISAVRGGSVFGEHELRFMGDLEEISISHKALSRKLFATGAIVLAKWLSKQDLNESKLYGLEDIQLEDLIG